MLDNPLLYSLFKWLPKDKCVITAHDGSIKSIMGSVTKSMFRKCYPNCKYVNMFSESQAALFKINYPGPEIFVIPLALKDFGVPNVTLRNDCVSFVSFGTMHAEKNIQLIIEAANQLFEEGVRNFKVSINGVWRISDTPNQLIRYPEIFEIRNTLIPNNDIPNLFCSNHYAIYAYKEMSQSGAVKVAFNYYTPVIVSDLPGFKDEVEEDINGYFFKSENIDSLKDVMRKCIDKTTEDYNALVGRMRDNIDRKYSVKALLPKYKAMFSKVLMMNKILTIVIPTYNMEKYLDKCLTSLVIEDRELMKQLEILVVIDGSKDRSSEIAHTYQVRYPQTFIVIDKENGNYGSCINRGLKEAAGKYIKVLDADDCYNSKSLQQHLELLRIVDVDLILTSYVIVNEKDR